MSTQKLAAELAPDVARLLGSATRLAERLAILVDTLPHKLPSAQRFAFQCAAEVAGRIPVVLRHALDPDTPRPPEIKVEQAYAWTYHPVDHTFARLGNPSDPQPEGDQNWPLLLEFYRKPDGALWLYGHLEERRGAIELHTELRVPWSVEAVYQRLNLIMLPRPLRVVLLELILRDDETLTGVPAMKAL